MIRKVGCAEILDDPHWEEIQSIYAMECLVGDAYPQREIYEKMEQSGLLHCFGAYIDGNLAGFVSVIVSVMPHSGRRMAGVESIFAVPAYRSFGVGNELIGAARTFACLSGCDLIAFTPRADSPFEKVLQRIPNCVKTHVQYTERFR